VSEEPSTTGVLGSVRQLEQALESTATIRAASETRLREARSEASRRVAAAQDEAAATAAERRRAMLAAAEADAAEISRAGAERATRIRADAQDRCAAVVEAALALILPADGKNEA